MTSNQKSNKGNGQSSGRGFASMDQERQREIASQGGRAAHEKGTAHEFTSEEAREAGRKGGESSRNNNQARAASNRNTDTDTKPSTPRSDNVDRAGASRGGRADMSSDRAGASRQSGNEGNSSVSNRNSDEAERESNQHPQSRASEK